MLQEPNLQQLLNKSYIIVTEKNRTAWELILKTIQEKCIYEFNYPNFYFSSSFYIYFYVDKLEFKKSSHNQNKRGYTDFKYKEIWDILSLVKPYQ